MKSIMRSMTLFSLIFILLFSTACSGPTNDVATTPLRRTELLMGTSITLSLYDHQYPQILDLAFDTIKQLENELSLNKDDTLLLEVNEASGVSPIPVNEALFDIVQKGLSYSALTDGAFDMTIGPIVKLWNIGMPEARVPSQAEIDAALPKIDYTNVSLNETDSTIYLEEAGMALDLGAIAKGYTADVIADLLKAQGVEHALVDLGGNIYTVGTKLDGTPWKVGIQDPFNPRNNIIGHISVSEQSIVTSGIYERFLDTGDATYHHILNPETGYPFDNEIAGVTIISNYSIDGDALSTSVFALGLEEGIEFVTSLEGIDAIFITKDQEVYKTEGLKDNFVLTSDKFKLID